MFLKEGKNRDTFYLREKVQFIPVVLKLCVHENWASMVAQTVKNLPAMQENGVQYLRLTNCRPHLQSSGPKVWDMAYDFFSNRFPSNAYASSQAPHSRHTLV